MFGKGMGARVLALLLVILVVATGARAGGELTPQQRRALEQEALKLNQQGIALYRQGKLPEATTAFAKALAIRQRLYPDRDHPDLAGSLANLGAVLRDRGDLGGAEKHLRDALAMFRKLYPDRDHSSLAHCLANLGNVLRDRGDLGGAEKHLREALAMRQRLYPDRDHPDLAGSLANLGAVLRDRGDLGGAEKRHRDALAMFRKLYPDRDHPDLARCLTSLGLVLRDRGDLGGAEKHLRDALAMRQRLFPDRDHPDLAHSLATLGNLLRVRGDLGGAEKHLRDALAMRQRLFPDRDHPDLAGSLANLGLVLRDRGDLGGAEKHLRDALAMRQRLYPDRDHPDLAHCLANLGNVLRDRGDLGGAEKHLRDALAMRQRLYPDRDHPDLANSLTNLGLVLRDRGDLGGAEKHLRDALAMHQRLFPDRGHPDLAHNLAALGLVLRDRGDRGGAEKHLRDALAMRQRLYPDRDHPDLADSLTNLSAVVGIRGDLGGAEKHFRDALAMRQRLYPDRDHPDLAQSLVNLGLVLRVRGDLGGAEKHLRDALAKQQRFLLREAGLLAEADAINLTAKTPLYRDSFLSVTHGRADDPTVYDLIWQGRSALTRLVEQRHRDLLASNDPSTRDLGEKLLSARQRLSHLLLAPATEAAKHAEEVRKLTETKEDLEKQLAQKLRLELPPADPTPPPPKRLAAALPTGAYFLDFYRYTHYEFDPQVKGNNGERVTPHYIAFVLGKDKSAVRVELGKAAPLEKAWAAWHQAITQNTPADKEREAAAGLAKLLWEPIRAKLPPGVHTLYLAPDQALTQVPWAALPGARPGTVLFEEYAFATVPHGPFLLERLAAKAPAADRGTLLAVGGVDYARPPAPTPKQVADASGALPAAGKAVVWRELKGTAPEAQRVAALAKGRGRLEPRQLTGPEATTDRVLAELPKARYAHLATHGFFADETFRSAFQVDPNSFKQLTRDRRGGARSPLVLSGLVFAGANRTGKEAAADRGILTAEGIVGLRLDGLELAVLSACNTGLGEVGGGEGVYGLQRAFHLAGCKNVIASLWAVEDESTAALMTLFYTNLWREKMNPLEALRQAQLYLYRHPQEVKQLARRDFEEVPLPRPGAAVPGPRARTAQWAAFTFSGVAPPPAGR